MARRIGLRSPLRNEDALLRLDNLKLDVYTCNMNGSAKRKAVSLPCACANLRAASRVVTRLYNKELREEEIEITQFTILMALDIAGDSVQGDLAELLEIDSTTLTRMLELLRTRGWVAFEEGSDRRRKVFSLTPAGREKFERAQPHWKRAQTHLERSLGPDSFGGLTRLLMTTVSAAR